MIAIVVGIVVVWVITIIGVVRIDDVCSGGVYVSRVEADGGTGGVCNYIIYIIHICAVVRDHWHEGRGLWDGMLLWSEMEGWRGRWKWLLVCEGRVVWMACAKHGESGGGTFELHLMVSSIAHVRVGRVDESIRAIAGVMSGSGGVNICWGVGRIGGER